MSVTVRFAPSPTGRLHAGNLLGARAGYDDRLLFEVLRTGRLGESGGRKDDSRRAEKNDLFHEFETPHG